MKILRIRDLSDRIGLGKTAIYARLDKRSPVYDQGFPGPINLGGQAVGWVESEIDKWLESRARASRPEAA